MGPIHPALSQHPLTIPSAPSLLRAPPLLPLPNLQPIPLSALLSLQILRIDLLRANLRERKRLAPPALKPLPHAHRLPIRPRQRANPRLHIPAQLQRDVLPVLQLARDVCDLVFGALALEVQFADGVGRLWRGLVLELRLLGLLGQLGFRRRRVDVVVLVPGCGFGGYDCVPDNGFGGRLRLCAGVDGFEVEEDLLGVPVEERG
jgi:hypothetical protein